MHRPIDPMVDCVFKAIFGDPSRVRLLISLLNAVLQRASPIVHVTITNPFNEKDFEADKLTVVDVRALAADGEILHVEVQTANHNAMRHRMLYLWADQYRAQLREGDQWSVLRPVCSVWILREPVAALPNAWHHRFRAWDPEHDAALSEHFQVHVLQLSRWSAPALQAAHAPDPELAALDAWMYFLKDAKTWRDLPPALATPDLEEAMSVLNNISEKESDYLRYQSRLTRLRDIAQFEEDLQEAREAAAAAQQEAAAAQQEAAAAQQEAAAAQQEAAAARAHAEAVSQAAAAAVDAAWLAQETAAANVEALTARLRAAGLLPE